MKILDNIETEKLLNILKIIKSKNFRINELIYSCCKNNFLNNYMSILGKDLIDNFNIIYQKNKKYYDDLLLRLLQIQNNEILIKELIIFSFYFESNNESPEIWLKNHLEQLNYRVILNDIEQEESHAKVLKRLSVINEYFNENPDTKNPKIYELIEKFYEAFENSKYLNKYQTIENNYKEKYLKYKAKYLALKKQLNQ
jgi:hypothetical protein